MVPICRSVLFILADAKDFVPLATPFIAAVVAFFTVRFTAGVFYRQRWWERKADAYAQVLESLYHLDAYFDVLGEEYASGKDKDEKYKARLLDSYSESYSNVRKVAAMGVFYLSDEACSVLKEYINHKHLDWGSVPAHEYFDDCCFAARKAIGRIREVAMKDLKLK